MKLNLNPNNTSNVGGYNSDSFKYEVGKVFYSIMDDHTPSKDTFEEYGGWNSVGVVFYLPYPKSRAISNPDIRQCTSAKPLFPFHKYIPLKEELILLFDLPSPQAQDNVRSSEKYYVTINLWNNIHHNSNPTNDLNLGDNFKEKTNINSLLPFEGDNIFEGRSGNTLRFGNTQRFNGVENFWSKTGRDGDPVILLVNGHKFIKDSFKPYVEDINEDLSSLYFTSSQLVDLKTPKVKTNPITNTIFPNKYIGAQILANSDKLVLNSKKSDINIFANTNIELYANEYITHNANSAIVLNSPKVFLGLNGDKLPTEPSLLGNKMIENYGIALQAISKFATELSSAISTPSGTPLLQIVQAASELQLTINDIMGGLDGLKSKTTYVAN